MANVRDKTAIVTGAARRVGAAIAEALAVDGWTVLAHVHHEEDEAPKGTLKVVADLAEADCAERIFVAATDLPPPRLLVNNAARFAWDGPNEFNPQEFDLHMAVNLRAPVALTAAFASLQQPGEDSLVVNILDSKVEALNPDYLSYTLSKIGLAGFTELAARAYASAGLRVNAIAPALIMQSPGQSEDNYRAMHGLNPLRRGVEVADVIGALRYLIDAPTVTGQTLLPDSGQRFMGLSRDVQFLGTDE